MKLTLHIDDAHAPAIIQLLATLIAKTAPVEAPADPAPGHPELPMESLAASTPKIHLQELPTVPGGSPAVELAKPRKSVRPWNDPSAADPLKVAMGDPVEDTRPALIPVTGKRYLTRDGKVMAARAIVQPHDRIETFVDGNPELPFYYERNGLPCGGCGPEWDLVSEIPNTADQ